MLLTEFIHEAQGKALKMLVPFAVIIIIILPRKRNASLKFMSIDKILQVIFFKIQCMLWKGWTVGQ